MAPASECTPVGVGRPCFLRGRSRHGFICHGDKGGLGEQPGLPLPSLLLTEMHLTHTAHLQVGDGDLITPRALQAEHRRNWLAPALGNERAVPATRRAVKAQRRKGDAAQFLLFDAIDIAVCRVRRCSRSTLLNDRKVEARRERGRRDEVIDCLCT